MCSGGVRAPSKPLILRPWLGARLGAQFEALPGIGWELAIRDSAGLGSGLSSSHLARLGA